MKLYEYTMEIKNKKYLDSLIVALVRQGYDVYIGEDSNIHFSIYESDLTEITYEKITV